MVMVFLWTHQRPGCQAYTTDYGPNGNVAPLGHLSCNTTEATHVQFFKPTRCSYGLVPNAPQEQCPYIQDVHAALKVALHNNSVGQLILKERRNQ